MLTPSQRWSVSFLPKLQTTGVQAFHFDRSDTKERAKKFMERGIYSVFIASDPSKNIDVGLAALYESHTLYAEGSFGTTQEFYVRPAFRSKGVGLDASRRRKEIRYVKRLETVGGCYPTGARIRQNIKVLRGQWV
jgi:GNAT superfamily N-acetyltransferase